MRQIVEKESTAQLPNFGCVTKEDIIVQSKEGIPAESKAYLLGTVFTIFYC